MYQVLIGIDARAQFEALTVKIRGRVNTIFERLAKWPSVSGVKALRGNRKTEYRIRTGYYRVLFTVDIEVKVIEVVKIGGRKDVYED